MFEVEDGRVHEVSGQPHPFQSDYFEVPQEGPSKQPASGNRQVSRTGYM